MDAPIREDPVIQIPHAAPTMLSPRAKATPYCPHPYGDRKVRTSAQPACEGKRHETQIQPADQRESQPSSPRLFIVWLYIP